LRKAGGFKFMEKTEEDAPSVKVSGGKRSNTHSSEPDREHQKGYRRKPGEETGGKREKTNFRAVLGVKTNPQIWEAARRGT